MKKDWVFFLMVCSVSINSILATEDWRSYEQISTTEKLKLIRQIESEFDYLANYTGWEEEQSKFFHFFDLNADGKLDLIFDGWSGGEPPCVRIYLNENNKFIKVFDEYQEVESIQLIEGMLTKISIIDNGCCGGYVGYHKDYAVDYNQGKISFKLSKSVEMIAITKLDGAKLSEPISFSVNPERYHLRHSPVIDSSGSYWTGSKEVKGNIVATYAKGTEGIAYAEVVDSVGRAWWLVEIDVSYVPLSSTLPYDKSTTKVAGWMSSRFLTRK